MFELIFGPLCLLSVAAAITDSSSKEQVSDKMPLHKWKPLVRMTKTVRGQHHEILYILQCPDGDIPEFVDNYRISMHKRVNGVLEIPSRKWRYIDFQRSVDSRLEWGWSKETLDIEPLDKTKALEFLMPEREIANAP